MAIQCPDPFSILLKKEGYICYEKYYHQGQWCYVFQRDPWDNEIVIRIGLSNQKFNEYCASGNVERIR